MPRQHATFKIFSGAVMTGTNVLTSSVIDTWMADQAGLEIQWTGTPSGTFLMKASNQYDPANNPNATFITVGAVMTPAFPIPAGAPGTYIGSISVLVALPQRWLRVEYTNSSGSGILDCWANMAGAA
jgi:hypothetical protein